MRLLGWDEFNSCVNSITNECKNKQFSGVYGFPRGGLCLAVAMSHSLNIPFLEQLKAGCLVVDDVYETEKTLNKFLDIPGTTSFVWYSKVQPQWWNPVKTSQPNEWLVFPWENRARAEEDMNAYQSSRNRSQ